MRKSFHLLVLIILGSNVFLYAQENEELIETEIAIYVWAQGQYGDITDVDGNILYKYTPPEVKFKSVDLGVIDMDVYPNKRTSFKAYKGKPLIEFFKEIKTQGQGDPQRHVVAQVQLPPETDSAILLFYPVDQAMSSFRVYPLLNTKKSIPEGHALIFNTTPFDIGGQFGNSPGFELGPNKRHLALLQPQDYFLRCQFWVRKGNEWAKAYSTKKAIKPNGRFVYIVHPRRNSDGSINPRLLDLLSLSAQ